jgi:hypothetical protein
MKIALIGEYSGVHTSLKIGLENLGHEVDIYSNGDGFKKIKSNLTLYPEHKSLLNKLHFYIFGISKLFKLISINYDIIQIINPHVVSSPRGNPYYYGWIINKLNKTKAIKSLAVVGCEANTQRVISALERSPCVGCLKDYGLTACPFITKNNIKITNHVERFANHIVPIGSTCYFKSYENHPKCREIVPNAVDISFIPARKNIVKNKIRILHGLSRKGFKGSDIILEALEKVHQSHSDFFEIIIPDKLKFDDYVKLLSTANVVVDQLYGDSLGMNALYSMGASCLVFAHFDRIKIGTLDLTEAPAIQVGETVDEIYQQIISLKSWSQEEFVEVGQKSRHFVLSHCSPVKVAQQVMKYWLNSSNTLNVADE